MIHGIKASSFIVCVLGLVLADDDLVMTYYGPVRGTTTRSFTGKEVDVFHGIPYAEPPIGSLRFAPPVEVKLWTAELNATGYTLPCYQREPDNHRRLPHERRSFIPKRPWTEDCLKLHIWIPKPRPRNATVMVYIHGGGFIMGDPQFPLTTGATIAAEENVIVVSMHYRLSILGFLYLGIPEAPGNAGLLDQQMALKWIQRNIANFGGNPDDVTIYGISAGGASVGFHLLAPNSGALFKRAIIMSGTPNAPWALNSREEALENSFRLSRYQGCTSYDKIEILKCLQSLHPEEIAQYNDDPLNMEKLCQFTPTVDGHFISDSPASLLRNKKIKEADIMIGTTAEEMSGFMPRLYPEMLQYQDGRITRKQFLSMIDKEFFNHDDLTRKMLSFLYTNWTSPEDPYHNRDGFIDLMSDFSFTCPSQQFADTYSAAGNRVYRYVVDFTTKIFRFPDWIRSPHGMDAILHAGVAAVGKRGNFSEEEAILSKKVMKWWANFARNGNPNNDDDSVPSWPQSTTEGREYLTIALSSSPSKQFRQQQCGFLLDFMDTLAKNRQNSCN